MERIKYSALARNAFYISAISLCFFGITEALRPGIVSWYLPLWVFAVATIVCGGVWMHLDRFGEQDHFLLRWGLIAAFALLVAVWSWWALFLLPFLVARVLQKD